jgi:hypothetical protein
MEAVTGIMKHTPVWVYFIFGYLVYVGIQSTKTRIVSVKRVLILPIVFAVWSLGSLVTSGQFESKIIGWLAALPVGILIGCLQTRRLDIKVDREHSRIRIPGTISTVIIIILTFSAKYYSGFMNSQYPAVAQGIIFVIVMSSISGLFAGILAGRMALYLYRYTTREESALTV